MHDSYVQYVHGIRMPVCKEYVLRFWWTGILFWQIPTNW